MMKVLIVDDKQLMRDSVAATLAHDDFQPIVADGGEAALAMVARHRPAAVVTDLKMPNMDGLELLRRLRAVESDLPVILMTAYATVETAVRALKDGAYDYIQKPFEGDDLIATVRRAVEHGRLVRENAALRCANDKPLAPRHKLVGDSPAMRQVRRQIERVAASHGTVLVTGESGTGKEIVAHIIHQSGMRRAQPMLCLNCAALSANLLESELFGHEKGAFTGADQLRKGRFELADGGTLLLDEISEIPPPLQAKLLRVLQERQYERVGSSTTRQIDVRVIATTNRDLDREVRQHRFREDLYYRLNVLPVHLPPLRERTEDIASLAEHFLALQAQRDGRGQRCFDAEALDLLRAYHWPGNVRELQNICERAAVLAPASTIDASVVDPWLARPVIASPDEADDTDPRTLEEIERQVIIRTLDRYRGHRRRTAEALGIGVRTLGLKLKKWKDMELVAHGV